MSNRKLPACFSREYLNAVDSFVILRDPNLNEFEVHVTKKSNKLYFNKGWSELKNVYDLSFGAWVTFGYVDPKFFTIRITTRWGVEVKYPTHSPPLKHLLDRTGLDNPPSPCVLRPSLNVYVPCRTFVRTFMKQVTKHDIQSGILTLPWNDFGEHVFTSGCSGLVLVDCLGERYQCKVAIGLDVEGQYICKVSGGWVDLCIIHGVDEGTRVGFCVAQPARDHVMYVTAYPQMGIQTILSYPLSDGGQVPLYVSQHYFLA
ncbi:hypothetical protein TSUD_239980 [Trifolium subterraneum]|uniref:TF-B3 domain-containing protein n=1 Tax=Trifolium subterraneum TaxID=3900 RepID=A0A2Z6PB47_TRISU|nr:hypothetical protein TSUD_239980 [Trifolium subterraneum]